MKKILISQLFLLFAGAQTAPQPFRDWFYERKSLPTLGDSCLAYTDKKVGELNWRLTVVFQPGKELPANIVISTKDESVVNKVIYSQSDSRLDIQKHFKSEFLDADFDAHAFWFAPSQFTNFYKYLRRGSALKVKYTQGVEKQVLFSLMGSTAATNRIAELCNNKKDFVPEAFYDYVDKININALPTLADASIKNAWDDMGDSWDFYLQSGVDQSNLNAVQLQIDPLVAKEREYLKQSGLLNDEIKSQEKQKSDLQALVITQKSQLANAQQNLDLENTKLQTQLLVLKDKEDIYRPVREESKPYFAAVDSAKQRVSTLNSQISATQEQIRQLKIKISNLWAQIDTLETTISNQQRQLSQLKSERIRANNEYISFNVDRELQRKLDSDSTYQRSLRDKALSDSEVIRKRDAVSSGESEVRDLERELRNCQATPTNDCSAIQNEVNLAKDKLNRAKQDYNSELALNRKLQQDIDNRKAALRRDTEDEKQRLADRVTQYDIDINNVESAIDQNEFKISSIRNSDIPRAEREQSAAENTLASQQSQLDTAKDSLRRSEQDLASFKARTDYDRKEREYLAADKEVQDTRNRMAVLDTQIRSLQLAISRNEAKIVSISSNIEKLISQLASTQTALKDVEAQLVPLNIQKNELTAKLQETQKNLKVNGENYRLNIRDLPLQKSLIPSFPTKFQDWL